jgi:hypothetical protein
MIGVVIVGGTVEFVVVSIVVLGAVEFLIGVVVVGGTVEFVVGSIVVLGAV